MSNIDYLKLQVGDTYVIESENENGEIVTVTKEVIEISEENGFRIIKSRVV